MILFLNFAPIEFMGGSEKWMLETSSKINALEKVVLMDVSPSIANLYGRLVIKRQFTNHLIENNVKNPPPRINLSLTSFIPFTSQWTKAKKTFTEARLIYARFEIAEILICLYFGGFNTLNKTIAGIILSPFYAYQQSLFDKLHNLVYTSKFYEFLLKKVSKVHVLNKRDGDYLLRNFHLQNLIVQPIGVDFPKKMFSLKKIIKTDLLQIIYVGELSFRKGTDTLVKIISESPKTFSFHIIGDGPLKNAIRELEKKANCKYHGYVSTKKLHELYSQSDVLIFPSRAEAFGLVMAEATAYGLKIVSASEVTLNLPNYIEETIKEREPKKYIQKLQEILMQKNNNKIPRKKIIEYAFSTFSKDKILPRFSKEVLAI